MALKSKSNQRPTKGANDLPQADAFLNLAVVDANGVQHRLPKGLALYIKDRVSKSMINAQLANNEAAKANGTEPVAITFQFTGTVYIQPDEAAEDILF